MRLEGKRQDEAIEKELRNFGEEHFKGQSR
jgi:hypothetical protein